MITDLWINLPVKNVSKSRAFFEQLGFSLNTSQGNTANSASFIVGSQKIVVMLFDEQTFKGFTNSDISDVTRSSEVLLSIGVDSKEEVDKLAEKAVTAGGRSSHQPKEMNGWMYGCLFSDLDGHRWNALYMDLSKMS